MASSNYDREMVWGLVIGVFLALTLSGCGGGGGSRHQGVSVVADAPAPAPTADGSGATGTISVAFSDAPASDEFTQALMVIGEIRLIGSNPDSTDVVSSGAPLTIDLLQLASFSEILFELEVPINSEYYALEFWAQSLTLVRADGSIESATLGENGYTPVPVGSAIPAMLRDQSGTDTIPTFGVRDSNPGGRLIVNVDVPLDVALHRTEDGTYHLSPLAFLSVPFESLFRVRGSVIEIVGPNATYPRGAFRICDLQKASTTDWIPQDGSACAFIAPNNTAAFLNDSADLLSGGVEDLTVGDPVVVYGWWGIYVEESNPIDALLVARGTGFERVRGPVSQSPQQDADLTLGGATGVCASALPVNRVDFNTDTLIFRKHGERTLPIDAHSIVPCAGIEVEGVRIASDELRAFVAVQRPLQLTGVLTLAASGSDRFSLSRADSAAACVAVGEETELTEFYYRSMGTYYGNANIGDLVGRPVTVIGLPGTDSCLDAERIVFVEQ